MKNLVFIYNAESGFFNKSVDFVHKLTSPSTYSCSLCAITHQGFGAKSEWKNFLSLSKLKISFIYKDELASRYPEFSNVQLPALINLSNGEIEISAKEMNQLTLSSLIDRLKILERE